MDETTEESTEETAGFEYMDVLGYPITVLRLKRNGSGVPVGVYHVTALYLEIDTQTGAVTGAQTMLGYESQPAISGTCGEVTQAGREWPTAEEYLADMRKEMQ